MIDVVPKARCATYFLPSAEPVYRTFGSVAASVGAIYQSVFTALRARPDLYEPVVSPHSQPRRKTQYLWVLKVK